MALAEAEPTLSPGTGGEAGGPESAGLGPTGAAAGAAGSGMLSGVATGGSGEAAAAAAGSGVAAAGVNGSGSSFGVEPTGVGADFVSAGGRVPAPAGAEAFGDSVDGIAGAGATGVAGTGSSSGEVAAAGGVAGVEAGGSATGAAAAVAAASGPGRPGLADIGESCKMARAQARKPSMPPKCRRANTPARNRAPNTRTVITSGEKMRTLGSETGRRTNFRGLGWAAGAPSMPDAAVGEAPVLA